MKAIRSPDAVAYEAPAIPISKTPQNSRSKKILKNCEMKMHMVTRRGLPLEMIYDKGTPLTTATKMAKNSACI